MLCESQDTEIEEFPVPGLPSRGQKTLMSYFAGANKKTITRSARLHKPEIPPKQVKDDATHSASRDYVVNSMHEVDQSSVESENDNVLDETDDDFTQGKGKRLKKRCVLESDSDSSMDTAIKDKKGCTYSSKESGRVNYSKGQNALANDDCEGCKRKQKVVGRIIKNLCLCGGSEKSLACGVPESSSASVSMSHGLCNRDYVVNNFHEVDKSSKDSENDNALDDSDDDFIQGKCKRLKKYSVLESDIGSSMGIEIKGKLGCTDSIAESGRVRSSKGQDVLANDDSEDCTRKQKVAGRIKKNLSLFKGSEKSLANGVPEPACASANMSQGKAMTLQSSESQSCADREATYTPFPVCNHVRQLSLMQDYQTTYFFELKESSVGGSEVVMTSELGGYKELLNLGSEMDAPKTSMNTSRIKNVQEWLDVIAAEFPNVPVRKVFRQYLDCQRAAVLNNLKKIEKSQAALKRLWRHDALSKSSDQTSNFANESDKESLTRPAKKDGRDIKVMLLNMQEKQVVRRRSQGPETVLVNESTLNSKEADATSTRVQFSKSEKRNRVKNSENNTEEARVPVLVKKLASKPRQEKSDASRSALIGSKLIVSVTDLVLKPKAARKELMERRRKPALDVVIIEDEVQSEGCVEANRDVNDLRSKRKQGSESDECDPVNGLPVRKKSKRDKTLDGDPSDQTLVRLPDGDRRRSLRLRERSSVHVEAAVQEDTDTSMDTGRSWLSDSSALHEVDGGRQCGSSSANLPGHASVPARNSKPVTAEACCAGSSQVHEVSIAESEAALKNNFPASFPESSNECLGNPATVVERRANVNEMNVNASKGCSFEKKLTCTEAGQGSEPCAKSAGRDIRTMLTRKETHPVTRIPKSSPTEAFVIQNIDVESDDPLVREELRLKNKASCYKSNVEILRSVQEKKGDIRFMFKSDVKITPGHGFILPSARELCVPKRSPKNKYEQVLTMGDQAFDAAIVCDAGFEGTSENLDHATENSCCGVHSIEVDSLCTQSPQSPVRNPSRTLLTYFKKDASARKEQSVKQNLALDNVKLGQEPRKTESGASEVTSRCLATSAFIVEGALMYPSSLNMTGSVPTVSLLNEGEPLFVKSISAPSELTDVKTEELVFLKHDEDFSQDVEHVQRADVDCCPSSACRVGLTGSLELPDNQADSVAILTREKSDVVDLTPSRGGSEYRCAGPNKVDEVEATQSTSRASKSVKRKTRSNNMVASEANALLDNDSSRGTKAKAFRDKDDSCRRPYSKVASWDCSAAELRGLTFTPSLKGEREIHTDALSDECMDFVSAGRPCDLSSPDCKQEVRDACTSSECVSRLSQRTGDESPATVTSEDNYAGQGVVKEAPSSSGHILRDGEERGSKITVNESDFQGNIAHQSVGALVGLRKEKANKKVTLIPISRRRSLRSSKSEDSCDGAVLIDDDVKSGNARAEGVSLDGACKYEAIENSLDEPNPRRKSLRSRKPPFCFNQPVHAKEEKSDDLAVSLKVGKPQRKFKAVKIEEGIEEQLGVRVLKNELEEASVKEAQRLQMCDAIDALTVLIKSPKKKRPIVEVTWNEAAVNSFLTWTEKYQPRKARYVLGDRARVKEIFTWLNAWKARHDSISKKMAVRAGSKSAKKGCSDDSDFDSDDEDCLCNTLLLSGPIGCGTTAAVYACAKQMEFKVIELNPSSVRTGKQIFDSVSEAVVSHQVKSHAHASPCTPADLQESREPGATKMASFFAKGSARESEARKVGMPSLHAASGESDAISRRNNIVDAMSLVLFEQVDIVYEELDKGFWQGLDDLSKLSKRPIILTSNASSVINQVDNESRFWVEHIPLSRPSAVQILPVMQLVCLAERVYVPTDVLRNVINCCHCDVRKIMLHLQFWFDQGKEPLFHIWKPAEARRLMKDVGGVRMHLPERSSDSCKDAAVEISEDCSADLRSSGPAHKDSSSVVHSAPLCVPSSRTVLPTDSQGRRATESLAVDKSEDMCSHDSFGGEVLVPEALIQQFSRTSEQCAFNIDKLSPSNFTQDPLTTNARCYTFRKNTPGAECLDVLSVLSDGLSRYDACNSFTCKDDARDTYWWKAAPSETILDRQPIEAAVYVGLHSAPEICSSSKLVTEQFYQRQCSRLLQSGENGTADFNSASLKPLMAVEEIPRWGTYQALGKRTPPLTVSDRKSFATDYLPYVRVICSSEEAKRDVANRRKSRRYLHYLDSIGMCADEEIIQTLSRSSFSS